MRDNCASDGSWGGACRLLVVLYRGGAESVAAVEVCEAVYAAARAAGRAAAAAQRAECGVSPFSDRTLSSLQAARQWARLQAIKRAYAADDRIRRGSR